MKKTYIIPAVLVTPVSAEAMIATSATGFNQQTGTTGVDGDEVLVKGITDNGSYWHFDWNE